MKKKHFEEPEMEVIRFNSLEIITATSGGGGEEEGYEQPTRDPETTPDPLL